MLTRLCNRSLRVVPCAGYATKSDAANEYLKKDITVSISDPVALKKRFLRDVHPSVIQSKAFDRNPVSAFRLGSATHHEGQHPEITKAIDEANVVDTQLEGLFTSLNDDDPVRRATSHFEFGNYRKGDEDSILNMNIDWDFFKQVIPDSSFVENVKKSYEETVAEVYQESITEDPIPKELKVFERFAEQMVRYDLFKIFFKGWSLCYIEVS